MSDFSDSVKETIEGIVYIRMGCPSCRQTYLVPESYFEIGSGGKLEDDQNVCSHCGWSMAKMLAALNRGS